MIPTSSPFALSLIPRTLLENRWGTTFVKERLAQEDRLRRGELPIRFFAHEIEESHHAFKIFTLFLRLTELYSVGIKNALNVQTVYHRFHLASLPSSFQPLRILQLSDLHIDGYPGFGDYLRKKIEPLPFDLVVLTGDYSFDLTQGFEQTCQELLALLPALRCRYGIYGILGNHDSLQSVPILEQLGIRMLVNERIRIETPEGHFWLVGVDDPHHFQMHDLPKALEGVHRHEPSILLSHSPEVIPQASQLGVDLYLTGHTHGGQICLPGGRSLFSNARCSREYIRGQWTHEKMRGYTTSGTGSSGIFARFNCPPELCIHTILPEKIS